MEKSAHWHCRKKPSFSSSLLDSIYRSIDESNGGSPIPTLSSNSKRQIPSIEKKWIPTPRAPPAILLRHFSTSSSSDPPPERKRQGSIRSRICDLRTSGSPRARLAAFLNAIFASGGRNPTKSKFVGCQEESAKSARCGKQRSVRFSPASIAAVDDGLDKRRFGEVARDLEVEESDCESESSSELFELENLSAIGKFRDELPVYGTTNVAANRAIAHGFIV